MFCAESFSSKHTKKGKEKHGRSYKLLSKEKNDGNCNKFYEKEEKKTLQFKSRECQTLKKYQKARFFFIKVKVVPFSKQKKNKTNER